MKIVCDYFEYFDVGTFRGYVEGNSTLYDSIVDNNKTDFYVFSIFFTTVLTEIRACRKILSRWMIQQKY